VVVAVEKKIENVEKMGEALSKGGEKQTQSSSHVA
jgi:hypothetical protein